MTYDAWKLVRDLALTEVAYDEAYLDYYGEHFGWEEVIERVVPEENFNYDENGKPKKQQIAGGGAYIRSFWRPIDKREEGRRLAQEWLTWRGPPDETI
jgi:hypothetical protein